MFPVVIFYICPAADFIIGSRNYKAHSFSHHFDIWSLFPSTISLLLVEYWAGNCQIHVANIAVLVTAHHKQGWLGPCLT